MKVLNIYSSTTGNTEKAAKTIEKVVFELSHLAETVKIE
jgi:flavodoxin